MPARRPNRKAKATLYVRGPSIDPLAAWQSFRDQHRSWLERLDLAAPLYCLPLAALRRLARPAFRKAPVIDPHSAQAERAFTELCEAGHIVGFWGKQLISYYLLSAPPPEPDLDDIPELAGFRAQVLAVRRQWKKGGGQQRLKGCAGWLLTEPAFLEEKDRLAARWGALPELERPAFPLGRAVRIVERPPGARPASPALASFAEALREFLDRWGVAGLATWDLPEPQGPLLPNSLPAHSPALPSHGLHLVLPLHYPLRGDDDLQRLVLEQQKKKAKELGLDPSLAGLRHYKAYAQMLEVIHVEGTIRSRYGTANRLPGFATQLENALAAALRCGRDQVQKLRKAISACQRGRRARVKWLQVTDG